MEFDEQPNEQQCGNTCAQVAKLPWLPSRAVSRLGYQNARRLRYEEFKNSWRSAARILCGLYIAAPACRKRRFIVPSYSGNYVSLSR